MNKSFLYFQFLFGSMIILGCSAVHVGQVIDHQGKQVNVNDANTCMECHNDMEGHSHPVMVPYPPKEKEKEYAPVADVEKAGIKLLDGKITCIVCHDLTNPQPTHPIKNLARSELCLVCHFK